MILRERIFLWGKTFFHCVNGEKRLRFICGTCNWMNAINPQSCIFGCSEYSFMVDPIFTNNKQSIVFDNGSSNITVSFDPTSVIVIREKKLFINYRTNLSFRYHKSNINLPKFASCWCGLQACRHTSFINNSLCDTC